ncbi:type VI secretion system ATPase TssH, partial [Myxococcota bacterium]|nr:type VI secretion system ATPase TssH [Myxococcota bacterium]
GSQHIVELGVGQEKEMRVRVTAALRAHFKPEFLNRVDDVVIYHALGRDQIGRILEIQLGLLRKRLAERRLSLELSQKALDWLAERGYDPQYGARPLKRMIQREVQDPLAMRILQGEFVEGKTVQVDLAADGESLRFS